MAERRSRKRDGTNGPTRSGTRSAARPGPSRVRTTARTSIKPSMTLPRSAAALTSRWESINPKRAVVLAAVLSLLALTLAVPMRTYFSQQTEFDELRSSNAQLQAEVRDYEEKVAEQNDPAYIEAQARERLQFVMPGEKPLLMQYPVPPGKSEEERKAEKQAGNPWYTNLWDSVSVPEK